MTKILCQNCFFYLIPIDSSCPHRKCKQAKIFNSVIMATCALLIIPKLELGLFAIQDCPTLYKISTLTCLNPLSSSELEAVPCMEVCTIDLARDFELPGLPTRNRGIRNSMQIAIMKTFSRRAAFLAMFGPRIMLSRSTSWQLKVMKISVFSIT